MPDGRSIAAISINLFVDAKSSRHEWHEFAQISDFVTIREIRVYSIRVNPCPSVVKNLFFKALNS